MPGEVSNPRLVSAADTSPAWPDAPVPLRVWIATEAASAAPSSAAGPATPRKTFNRAWLASLSTIRTMLSAPTKSGAAWRR